MPELLLPGTKPFRDAQSSIATVFFLDLEQSIMALHTIENLWTALRDAHAATVPSMSEAWSSEELKAIREAIEEEAT